jgi:hypothetical protein
MERKEQCPPTVYKYKSLNLPTAIRVLQFHPTTIFEEWLQCDIIHLDCRKLPKSLYLKYNRHEAVSYVWGEPHFTKQIVCNGTSFIDITPNVGRMLRYFRRSKP